MNEDLKKDLDARFELLESMIKIVNLKHEISGDEDFNVDWMYLDWRYQDCQRAFHSGDIHLMFSASKLANRHVADVEKRFYEL